MLKRLLLATALLFAALQPALAVDPAEVLDDPALEARARDISKGLRCVVCQNQSIDDSDATLARDLRLLVRERLTAGDSNKQVVDYVVSRYGDFVLLKPPFKFATLALWLGPLLFVALALIAAFAFFRRQRAARAQTVAAPALSDEQKKRLDDLLKGDGS
jgi:cytochrome c-type biogenesis protein CcmH